MRTVLRRSSLLAVTLALALPAVASAAVTITNADDPEGTTPPVGATPGTKAEIVRATVSRTAHCYYQVTAQYGTSDDGTWVRDQNDANFGTPPAYADSANGPTQEGPTNVEIVLSELRPNTIYHYRFQDSGSSCASDPNDENSAQVPQDQQKTVEACFRSGYGKVDCPAAGQPAVKPFVDMRNPTSVSGGSATLHAIADANGCSSGQAIFEWGSTEDNTYKPGQDDAQFPGYPPYFGNAVGGTPTYLDPNTITQVSTVLGNLQAGWLYHVRIGAIGGCYDSDGHNAGVLTDVSSERCLMAGKGAVPCKPASTAETTESQPVGDDTKRRLNGIVHQHGCASFWFFKWGFKDHYKGHVTPGGSLAAGSGDKKVSEIAGGFKPGSEYEYELHVKDALDCDTGKDLNGGERGFLARPPDPSPQIQNQLAEKGLSAQTPVISDVFAGLIPKGTNTLISEDGAGLVGNNTGNLIPKGTSSLISEDGAGLVGNNTGNLIPKGTNTLISEDGAGFKVNTCAGCTNIAVIAGILSNGSSGVVSVGAGNLIPKGTNTHAASTKKKGKLIVIAYGRQTFVKGGAQTLTVYPTTAGKKLLRKLAKQAKKLRKAHKKQPKLSLASLSGLITPHGRATYGAQKLKLKFKKAKAKVAAAATSPVKHFTGKTSQNFPISFNIADGKVKRIKTTMTYDCYDVLEEVQTGSTEHYAETHSVLLKGPYKIKKDGTFFGRREDVPKNPGQSDVFGERAGKGKFTGRAGSNYNQPNGDICQAPADLSWNAHKVKQP